MPGPDDPDVAAAKRLLDAAKRVGFAFQRVAPGEDGPLFGVRETLTGAVASVKSKIRQAWSMRHRCRRVPASRSGFAGFRYPPDVILVAVRWYLRYALSYRDVEELLAERGVIVDHVSV